MNERAVRGIIQFPYRGSRGEQVGVLLLLQHHPRTNARSYILPGGTLNSGEDFEAGLKRELREELNIDVTRLGPYYEYTGKQNRGGNVIGRTTRVYIVTELRSDGIKLQKGEVDGIGGFGVGSRRIPQELLEGHVKALPDNFYHNPKFMPFLRVQTRGLPRFSGFMIREGSTPNGIIPWDEQRNLWNQWVAEKRGLPPVSRS